MEKSGRHHLRQVMKVSPVIRPIDVVWHDDTLHIVYLIIRRQVPLKLKGILQDNEQYSSKVLRSG